MHLATLTVQSTGHATATEWAWTGALLAIPAAVLLALVIGGDRAQGQRGVATLVLRPAATLERLTGLPGWSAAGVAVGFWALNLAAVGFFWDVAWHIDLGRDTELLTPPHTLILAGLVGIGAAGVASVVTATVSGAGVGLRLGRLRAPWGALALIALGAGATTGFPLDDLWHANYGVDVTMWGPTHLLMIGGAALSPLAVWMLVAEAGPGAGLRWTHRHLRPTLAVATLIGLSAFQLEFDDGVPQWQALVDPVIIAAAAGFGLVLARVALGRWAAIRVAVGFLAFRGLLALLVGPVLGHDLPRMPLYLGIALCVEAAFWVRWRSLAAAAVAAGALIGTVGLATEWGWSQLISYQPWQPSMLSGMWAAAGMAVAAALLGAGVGAALAGQRLRLRLPAPLLAAAGLAFIAFLSVPLPRTSAAATATVTASPAGAPRPVVDRFGRASLARDVTVDVRLAPGDAAANPDWFWVISWQGGGRVAAPLHATGPGHYAETTAVPTGGSWKTIVFLARGSELMATPVSMPEDPQYNQPAVAVAHGRTAPMVPASALLVRELHGGATWPAALAYSGLVVVTLMWVLVLGVAAVVIAQVPLRSAGAADAARRPLAGGARSSPGTA